ncbi:MAG: TIGR03746 family integrating conjugative element protein [Gammaproteobacteria bacterium]
MSRYDDLLAGKDKIIRVLWSTLIITAALAALLGIGWMQSPKNIRVYIPPDLSNGASMSLGEIKKGNIYLFALKIWQQLNRWDTDGSVDYEKKITQYKDYLTPACYQDRLDSISIKRKKRELSGRQRTIEEIPGRGFSNKRVQVNNFNSWTVSLDVQLKETMLGETIKIRHVNYPIRVVRYNVDPQNNIFGLAIDCLADAPRRINLDSQDKENEENEEKTDVESNPS